MAQILLHKTTHTNTQRYTRAHSHRPCTSTAPQMYPNDRLLTTTRRIQLNVDSLIPDTIYLSFLVFSIPLFIPCSLLLFNWSLSKFVISQSLSTTFYMKLNVRTYIIERYRRNTRETNTFVCRENVEKCKNIDWESAQFRCSE